MFENLPTTVSKSPKPCLDSTAFTSTTLSLSPRACSDTSPPVSGEKIGYVCPVFSWQPSILTLPSSTVNVARPWMPAVGHVAGITRNECLLDRQDKILGGIKM